MNGYLELGGILIDMQLFGGDEPVLKLEDSASAHHLILELGENGYTTW